MLDNAKCIYKQHEIAFLGHVVGSSSIRPDHERVKALLDIQPLSNKKALQRVVAIFYYAKWLVNFSD